MVLNRRRNREGRKMKMRVQEMVEENECMDEENECMDEKNERKGKDL